MKKAIKITDNVYYVGAHDYNLRDFHGSMYPINEGATYNAYLIVDEKITLIDTVEIDFYDEMLERIRSIIGDRMIDNIIIQHAESDHSSAFMKLMNEYPKAKAYVSISGKRAMLAQFFKDYDYQSVKTGDTLNIGRGTLTFIEMPMIHWPDNMATYFDDDRILFSNDAFGQHIISFKKFDDDHDYSYLIAKAKEYYANIVMPYGKNVLNKLKAIADLGLAIDYIAPSHGIIWHKYIGKMLADYKDFASLKSKDKVVIVYESVWNNTKTIAETLAEGLGQNGIEPKVYKLSKTDSSLILSELLDAKALLIGSGCYNNTLASEICSFIDKAISLNIKDKYVGTFGSYGWNKLPIVNMDKRAENIGILLEDFNIAINYAPTQEDLEAVYERAQKLAKFLKEKN